jgi:hypothetical protein
VVVDDRPALVAAQALVEGLQVQQQAGQGCRQGGEVATRSWQQRRNLTCMSMYLRPSFMAVSVVCRQ